MMLLLLLSLCGLAQAEAQSASWCGWTDWACHTEADLSCTRYRERFCLCGESGNGTDANCAGSWHQVTPNVSQQQCKLVNGVCSPLLPTGYRADGGWCGWTAWSSCGAGTALYGCTGSQDRRRRCLCPSQQGGGRACAGDATGFRSCSYDPHCANWCAWAPWQKCPKLVQRWCDEPDLVHRNRSCDCPSPQRGSLRCPGFSHEMRSCPCYRQELSAPIIALLVTTCIAFFGAYVTCFIFQRKGVLSARRLLLRLRREDEVPEDNPFPPTYNVAVGETWPEATVDFEQPPDYDLANAPLPSYDAVQAATADADAGEAKEADGDGIPIDDKEINAAFEPD